MRSGPSIHPVTRQPREERKAADQARTAAEMHKLRAQADRLQLQEDPVIDLLLRRIQKRVDELIAEDPEAQGYVALLNDIGQEVNLARRAASELAKRAGFRKDGGP